MTGKSVNKKRAGTAKRPKKPAGTVRRKYASEGRSQIPVVSLCASQTWIAEGIDRYRAAVEKDIKVKLSLGSVLRRVLTEELQNLKTVTTADFDATNLDGPAVAWIGPTRLDAASEPLLQKLEAVSQRFDVTWSAVIRWALMKWLTDNGFGDKAKRKG